MTDTPPQADSPRTVGQALDYCARRLDTADVFFGHGTDNPWDEAVQLVLSVADLPLDSGDGVLPHPLSASQSATLEALLSRRIDEHVPLPYLLGQAWFAGLPFACDERALVPRSPIAELVLSGFAPWYRGEPRRLLDLCCGGGSIGLACAHYLPEARVDLADIDADALALARENRHSLRLTERVECFESDLFSALPSQLYDVIVSNPPYVDVQDLATMPAEYQHEPPLGLGSGRDGLDLTRKLLAQAGEYLAPDGVLVVEVGNSAQALELAYPEVPFTWVEFEHGGHGVFVLSGTEVQEYGARFFR